MLLGSIPVEVNGYKLKAFVDSGAQMTISKLYPLAILPDSKRVSVSPGCAEKCK